MAKPFFKWPGSKAWLIERVRRAWPEKCSRVVEPFAGSAAFFLGGECESALLADANHLIADCLKAVRDQPKTVLEYLSEMRNEREEYIRVREESLTDPFAASARLIYLTNTSWGGLYRENVRGKFNVPFGNNGRKVYCERTILSASDKLQNASVQHARFEQTLANVKDDDLIFIDAPYVTASTSGFFDRYRASRFSWEDQLVLARLLNQNSMARSMILITCAADPELYNLFPDWDVFEFTKRNSMTAHVGKGGYRSEALLVSPSLRGFSKAIEAQGLGQRRGHSHHKNTRARANVKIPV